MAESRRPVLLGITGGTGAGKSTLARLLLDALKEQAVLLSQDWYYRDTGHLPASSREALNFDHPEALDHELFAAQLAQLRDGKQIEAPQYDFLDHTRLPHTLTVMPAPLIIAEGLHLLSTAALRTLWDFSVYMDAPSELRLARRIDRDMRERGRHRAAILRQFHDAAAPMHAQFIEPAKDHAHLILPGDTTADAHRDRVLGALQDEFGFYL